MTDATSNTTQGAPVGEYFIARDIVGDIHGWGQVLGCPGAGILFCAIHEYYGRDTRQMVPAETSARWSFFQTLDECMAELPRGRAA